MKTFKLIAIFLLLLSHGSSASLVQLHYRDFYAPPSPTNFPVDRTGLISFVFDETVEDTNANPFEGRFVNPIKSGYMFLRGIRYDIDIDMPVEFTTQYSARSSFKATGTMFNNDVGRRDSFYLHFGGDFLSESIGWTLASLDLTSCYENHLNLINSDKIGEFYESGNVQTEIASVPEPASIMLLVLGLAGILLLRTRSLKKNFI